jgi:hypothetical protein
MRVRERGRGPNRKRSWWWTGEVDSEGQGWVQEKRRHSREKRQKRQRRRRTVAGGREAGSVGDVALRGGA